MTAPPPVSHSEPHTPQWAPPDHPSGPTPPAGYPGTPGHPPQQPCNGLGTAALVIGSIGSFIAFIPFLFWIAGILGILAVVFGLIGYRSARKGLATNKTSALGGAALGGITLALAVVMVFVAATFARNMAHESEKATERRDALYAAPPTPEEEPEHLDNELVDDEPVKFGEMQHYGGGVQLTVAQPDEFAPDGRISGVHVGDRAIRIRMTIVNNSDEPLDLTALPHVEDANGKYIDPLFGHRAGSRPFEGILAPGARATAQYPYVLPPGTTKGLRVEVAASQGYAEGTWTGRVG
ncbi:DUF4190 domain-containing protein [Streptomyces sp. NPDC001981]|uniref:DUF4190 domain-containing protein n=1 Tax=Streptomyces sp. NPDC001981 TaxID=3364628 RepID=UPI0036AB15FC